MKPTPRPSRSATAVACPTRRARGDLQRGHLDLAGLECRARYLQVGHCLTQVIELFLIASGQ